MLKKIITTFVAIFALLLGISTSAKAGSVPDEQYLPANSTSSDVAGVWFDDNIDMTRMPTLLYGVKGQFATGFCSSLSDSKCANAERFNYVALLPPCATETSVDCIESFYAVNNASPVKIIGTFDNMVPSAVDKKYAGDVSAGLPEGSNSGIWTLPGVKNKSGTEKYVVIVSRSGTILRQGSNSYSSAGFGDFRAGIFPIATVNDPAYRTNVPGIEPGVSYGAGISHPSQKDFRICAIVADGECETRQSFPDDTQFGLRIRLSTTINGWVHGRIENPLVDYQARSYGSVIDIQGLPTKVPTLDGWVSLSSLTQSQKSDLLGNGFAGRSGSQLNPNLYGDAAMQYLNSWAKVLGDKATAMPTQWIFHTLSDYEMQGANNCIKASKKLAGLVSTNSTTYSAGPPTFNKDDQTLDYKVASPHLDSKGEVFKGTYDLYIDENVARCIYGFTSAPISATVSVVSSDGQGQVATTVLSKGSGWLHLSAKGFTFSNPTLKVKLIQDANATDAPPAKAIPTKSTSKSITCIKGKVTKVVTTASCPSGYRRKG